MQWERRNQGWGKKKKGEKGRLASKSKLSLIQFYLYKNLNNQTVSFNVNIKQMSRNAFLYFCNISKIKKYPVSSETGYSSIYFF